MKLIKLVRNLADLCFQDRHVTVNDFLIIPIHFQTNEYISFEFAGGWMWLRLTSTAILAEDSNCKNNSSFSLWGLQASYIPFFAHFHGYALQWQNSSFCVLLFQQPLGNQNWLVSIHLLKAKGCKSMGHGCKWDSLTQRSSWVPFGFKSQWTIKVENDSHPANTTTQPGFYADCSMKQCP